MANPEPATEPTMEEILASIRRIISDDESPADSEEGDAPPADDAEAGEPAAGDGDAAEAADAEPDKTESEPEADDSNDQSAIDDIFELTEVVDEDGESDGDDASDDDSADASDEPAEIDFDSVSTDDAEDAADLDFVDAEAKADEPEPEPETTPQAEPAAASSDGTARGAGPILLSPEAQATASAAFGALASTMLSHSGGARTLEEIVEDLLRPLLKAWLDQNLPPLVEKLVREEIERVARRGS